MRVAAFHMTITVLLGNKCFWFLLPLLLASQQQPPLQFQPDCFNYGIIPINKVKGGCLSLYTAGVRMDIYYTMSQSSCGDDPTHQLFLGLIVNMSVFMWWKSTCWNEIWRLQLCVMQCLAIHCPRVLNEIYQQLLDEMSSCASSDALQ